MMKRYLAKRNHPWELLVIAALFLIPAVMMLSKREPFLFPSFGNRVAKVTV
jgi:sterol desaturase/sphingolipid hydroxylase (fatty acid hydroxylase superfamily)